MLDKANILSERLLNYAVEIINLTMKLRINPTGTHIANQLIRCGTSNGANYEEVCAASSRADFINKMTIVLKETRESLFWIRVTDRAKILNGHNLKPLLDETTELMNIMAKSIITARNNK